MILHLDIETKSSADLRKTGVYRYVEDPDFEILMLAWGYDDEPIKYTSDPDEISDIVDKAIQNPAVKMNAWNAGFERVCFSQHLGMPVGEYIDPDEFEDSMVLSAIYGYPLSLDAAAKHFGMTQKDSAGTALIRWFSVPRPDGTFRKPEDHPKKWQEFLDYCVMDVEAMRDIYDELIRRHGGYPNDEERSVWLASEEINDRGVLIDREFTEAAVAASEANRERDIAKIEEITGLENGNSPAQLGEWIRERIPDFPNLQKATVDEYLAADDTPDDVRQVLELRQSTALAAAAKYLAALRGMNSDDRLRGTLRYFGAHTGRFSGRQMQLQNLPSSKLGADWEVEAQIIDVKLGAPTSQAELKDLVRPSIMGPLCVADFSSIEARVIAWFAGEETLLESFREGKDFYATTAATMYGVSYEEAKEKYRKEGKVTALSCGFGGGAKALQAFGAPGTESELWDMVNRYREANPNIVQFWRDLEEGFINGGNVGSLRFEKDGADRYMYLPSGRPIVYRGCKRQTREIRGKKRKVITYQDMRRGGMPTSVYSGIIANNSVQGTARELMANSLVSLERAGYRTVSTVHDEVLVEAEPDRLDDVVRLMTTAPVWAEGLPFEADGYTCARYVKR